MPRASNLLYMSQSGSFIRGVYRESVDRFLHISVVQQQNMSSCFENESDWEESFAEYNLSSVPGMRFVNEKLFYAA